MKLTKKQKRVEVLIFGMLIGLLGIPLAIHLPQLAQDNLNKDSATVQDSGDYV